MEYSETELSQVTNWGVSSVQFLHILEEIVYDNFRNIILTYI